MAESSGEAKVYLRLVIDEEKNKVVLAEASKDFVDVLFSFLSLPMGTIARLFKKHKKNVGCFNNIHTSVVDMGIDHFQSEACKQMLLYPRSVRDVHFQRLKVNINPTEGDKYFKCPSFSHCRLCSNFSTTRCRCGKLMKDAILEPRFTVADSMQNGVFVRGSDSTTFIITDDLEVAVKSTALVLERLKSFGCADVSKLVERVVGIGYKEVLALLQCVFYSNAPLTDTFLNKGSPNGVTKSYETLRPLFMEKKDEAEPEMVLTLNAVVRKKDMKILFVDCGEDFVELLLSFLAVPLESVWEISGNSITLGCFANLCRSFKGLRVDKGTQAAPAEASKVGVLPCFYNFKVQLPGIITLQPPVYYRYIQYFSLSKRVPIHALTRDSNKIPNFRNDKLVPVTLVDPKSHGNDQLTLCSGFLKKLDTKFTVSDDLAVDLLRASLVTSCALGTALCDFIAKKPKKEPICETQLRRSQRKKHKVNGCQSS
ncbi:hypothetical protein Bca101_015763 [Brassica carinata]